MKPAALLFTALSLCWACDCTEPSVEAKRSHAELIFRGTIIELRDASQTANTYSVLTRYIKKTVVFRVSRVWKGNVGQTFEMPAVEETSACIGFWPAFLKVGQDLLVYAGRFGGAEYLTSICGNHKPAMSAGEDFRALGPGKEPQKSAQASK